MQEEENNLNQEQLTGEQSQAEPANSPVEPTETPKKSKLPLIIIVIVLLLSTGGYYWFFMKQESVETEVPSIISVSEETTTITKLKPAVPDTSNTLSKGVSGATDEDENDSNTTNAPEEATDPDEKETYEMLAQWESGHHKFLHQLNEDLKEQVWNDNSFWPF